MHLTRSGDAAIPSQDPAATPGADAGAAGPMAETPGPSRRTGTAWERLARVTRSADRQADRIIPAVAATVIFAGLFTIAWLESYTLIADYDRAYFKQAVWLVDHGHPLFITSRALHLLGDHASPIIYPVAWVAGLFPLGVALQLVSASALGLAAVLLYRFARLHAGLGQWAAGALVAAFALYPALHNLALAGFHPEVLALPALVAATHYGLLGRWWPYAACLAVTFATKEDMAIAGTSLAFLLFLNGRRKAAGITLVAGAAYLAFAVGWLSPHFAGDGFVQTIRFAAYGDSMGEVIGFMITNPGRVLADLFGPEVTTKMVALLGPLLFLPLLSPAYLLPALPLEFLLLATNHGPARTVEYHYTVAFTAFAFLATAMSLGRLRLAGVPARKVGAAMVTASLFFFVQYANDSPLRHPWQWRTRDAVDEARLAANRMIPPDAPVAAGSGLLELFADRQFVYNAPMPFLFYVESEPDPIPVEERRRHVDWAVIDMGGEWLLPVDRVEVVERLLPSWGFEPVWERHGIVVLERTSRPDTPLDPAGPP